MNCVAGMIFYLKEERGVCLSHTHTRTRTRTRTSSLRFACAIYEQARVQCGRFLAEQQDPTVGVAAAAEAV